MYRKLLNAVVVGVALLTLGGEANAVEQGAACGGSAGVQCDAGLFCELATGACGKSDASGRCAKVAEICNQRYQPVCGCDGKTYGNDCMRQAAKASKAHDGKCS